ncbi:MAG TPA: hypothetical protein VFY73_17345 [Ideonella sp.]|uniref:hypothetical protein n=1 Tax=Ideonella sp. TaxID=1929293 RepID=UPI002E2FF7DA|nr:hypothetical protein [Ideonella sp.]HEX5685791.1 hypothetical protein [Ideonella sp.]
MGTITKQASDNRDGSTTEQAAQSAGTAGLAPTLGGALGGAAAGAAAGTVAGPAGALVGAATGAMLGGWVGKSAAASVDPTAEDTYWQQNFHSRPYAEGARYEDFGPAYRYGVNAFQSFPDRSFDDMEPELSRHWPHSSEGSTLDWERAKHATRDAWTRLRDAVERAVPGDSDNDGL